MTSENLCLITVGLIMTCVFFFFSGVTLKRHERTIVGFYWALREKYPHSYIKPNGIIKKVRNFFKMEDDDTVHRLICLLHYFQLVMPTAPLFLLFLPLFMPLEKAIVVFCIVGMAPFTLICFTQEILLIVQCIRCKKIQKTDPKYKDRVFYNWRG